MKKIILLFSLIAALSCTDDDVEPLCIGYCGEQQADKVHYLIEDYSDLSLDSVFVQTNIESRMILFEGKRSCLFYAGGPDFNLTLDDIQQLKFYQGTKEIVHNGDITIAEGVEYAKSDRVYYILAFNGLDANDKTIVELTSKVTFECNDTK